MGRRPDDTWDASRSIIGTQATVKHLVASAAFTEARRQGVPQGSALVSCECEWSGPADDFKAHRKAAGAPKGERIKAMSERVDWTRESAVRWNHQRRKRKTS